MTAVSGEDAARFNAVRLDNFENANRGELVEADDLTGLVRYKRCNRRGQDRDLG